MIPRQRQSMTCFPQALRHITEIGLRLPFVHNAYLQDYTILYVM